jgi:hypothetical protein
MTNERAEGYYWVRHHADWEVVHFDGKYWWQAGSDQPYVMIEHVATIGPKIEPPEGGV